MSQNRTKMMGAGMQNATRGKNKGKLQRRQTVTPGSTLSLRASIQVFYKYGHADDEEVIGNQYNFARCTANSKAMSASWAEEIELVLNTKHRHHLSLLLRVDEDKFGKVFEVEFHAHKYVKDNADGSESFRESIKYKTDEKDRNPKMSQRWYDGIVGVGIKASGNITGNGEVPENSGSGGKIVPVGNPDDPLILKFTLKSIMQAPQSASADPEAAKHERQRAAAARRQLCYALLLIFAFLGSGAVFFPLVENWTVLDSIYFGMVTVTTVGYGDMGPVTVEGRIFTSIYVMAGVGIIGVAVGIIGGYVMEKQAKMQELVRN
jgi:voltage-gated potassium channel